DLKKPPCQNGSRPRIRGDLEFARTDGFEPAAIERVLIRGPVMSYIDRPFPKTGLEGKFSYQYMVAAALLDGQIGIDTFRDSRRFAPEMEAMLGKIEMRMDAAIPANFEEMWVEVTVRARDGCELQARCDRPRGIWGNPLTAEQRLTKFRNTAGVLLAPADVEEARALIERLETVPRLSDLITVLQRVRPAA